MNIIKAHKFSSIHRNEILKSKNCGCFYCLNIFTNDKIKEWCDKDKNKIGQTAICPKCGIDSIIPDYVVDFDKEFLTKMNKHWF
jgi:hypothetical protein